VLTADNLRAAQLSDPVEGLSRPYGW
jgi:hypothetical protein